MTDFFVVTFWGKIILCIGIALSQILALWIAYRSGRLTQKVKDAEKEINREE